MATLYVSSIEELSDHINSFIRRGFKRNGRRIFDLSQNTSMGYVPVKSGRLKNSGWFTSTDSTWKIGYNAPYAVNVELGTSANKGDVQRTSYVKPYTRKGYKDKKGKWHPPKLIPGYFKPLQNKRTIDVKLPGGGMGKRRIKVGRGRQGRRFLTRAFNKRILELKSDIEASI